MDMPKPRRPYLRHEKNRHGTYVWYFRVGNGKRIRIKAKYGTAEFNSIYDDLIAGRAPTKGKNTISWMVDKYRHSGAWKALAATTRKQREVYLRQMEKALGNKHYKTFTKKDMMASVDSRRDRPSNANKFIKAMRHLYAWAEIGIDLSINPTIGIKYVADSTDGFTPWELEDITKYRNYWPIGTKQRMVMEMFLWWGLRRSDIVRVGKQHFRNGVGSIKAQKNGVDVPLIMTDYLQNIIDQTPTGDLTYIVTDYGVPRSSNGLGNWFSDSARKAGLKGLSAHGLRKTAAELLAEASGTDRELMSYMGWKSDSEVKRYTEKARRKRMAIRVAQKRLEDEIRNPIAAPLTHFAAPDKIINENNDL